MLARPHVSATAQLFFTRDFHQLPRGRVEPGAGCTIAYDPARIVPPGKAYVFGSPHEQIVAHLQFQLDGPALELPLESWSGIKRHTFTTLTGAGPLLRARFTIPSDARLIMIWFSYRAADGHVYYDSAFGRNYRIRFVHELSVLEAHVEGEPQAPLHTFHCRVAAVSLVERITVSYRVTNVRGSDSLPHQHELQRRSATADGRVLWELDGVPVPHNAVVAFEFLYNIDGQRHRENNQGRYFLTLHKDRLPGGGPSNL